MTCKHCIYYKICKRDNSLQFNYVSDAEQVQYICDDFLYEPRIIILPCSVGTPIYVICKNKYINTGKFKLSDIEKIGKTVFLNKEDAEKALKESE